MLLVGFVDLIDKRGHDLELQRAVAGLRRRKRLAQCFLVVFLELALFVERAPYMVVGIVEIGRFRRLAALFEFSFGELFFVIKNTLPGFLGRVLVILE